MLISVKIYSRYFFNILSNSTCLFAKHLHQVIEVSFCFSNWIGFFVAVLKLNDPNFAQSSSSPVNAVFFLQTLKMWTSCLLHSESLQPSLLTSVHIARW